MGNRKLPFGYILQDGKIFPHPAEHICVQRIFDQYQLGASFSELVTQMIDSGVPYDDRRLWNKSMVARILSNEKYTGQSPYPSIITEQQFLDVSIRRKERQNNAENFASQKILRKICTSKVTPEIVSQVRSLMNHLIKHPEYLHPPKENCGKPPQLREDLREALTQSTADEEVCREWIQELISSEYSSISSAHFETAEIKQLLLATTPTEEVQETLIKKCVRKILVTPNAPIQLILKNGQIIERSLFP